MNSIFLPPSDSTTWDCHTGSPQEPVCVSAGVWSPLCEKATAQVTADFTVVNVCLCTDFPALSTDLCFRAEAGLLTGHGYPVWKWGVLGKIMQGSATSLAVLYYCIFWSFVKQQEPLAAATSATLCLCSLLQAVLLVMSIKLMGQMKRKQEFMALLQSNRYVPGAF